jgi:hypothetical protein
MKLPFALFLLIIHTLPIDGWDLFARVKFTPKFYKELNEQYLAPFLDSKIRFYEGKEISLKGHYLPYDMDEKNTIIISKVPFSQCFFCGGAGPESVAEIVFSEKRPRFKADEIITVIGILKLNEKDINRMNFILEQARIEKD